MNKYKIQKNRGFSLTELSVSLAIVAVIAGSAISVAVTSDTAAKTTQTNAKLDRIEEALAGYVGINKRLPCPADPTLTTSSGSFGDENVTAGTPDTCANSYFNTGTINGGAVPVRTLQLPDDYMFDGWGRRISYIVDERFTNNSTTTTCANDCLIDTATATVMTVEDESGTNRTTSAIYILFSHGENGHGAYPKNGGSTRINFYTSGHQFTLDATPLNNDEFENAHFDQNGSNITFNTTFVQRDYIRRVSGTYFDDLLRYKIKSQVIREADSILYQSECDIAKDINDNPGSNDCTGADNESMCESFATEIVNICLQ